MSKHKSNKPKKNRSLFKIDYQKLASLKLEEKIAYYDRMIRRILNSSKEDIVKVSFNGQKYEVSAPNAKVLLECFQNKMALEEKLSKRPKNLLNRALNSFRTRKSKSISSSSAKRSALLLLAGFMAFQGNNIAENLEHRGKKGTKKSSNIESFEVGNSRANILSDRVEANSGIIDFNDTDTEYLNSKILESYLQQANAESIGQGVSDLYESTLEKYVIHKVSKENCHIIDIDSILENYFYEEEQKRTVYDEYLEMYSNYFDMNPQLVIELTRRMTNDYEIDLNAFIPDDLFKFEDAEAKVMSFIYHLNRGELDDLEVFKRVYEKMGIVNSDLLLGTDRHTREEGEELVLDSGMSGEEFIGHISNLLGIDRNYLLSISYYETGIFSSPLCRGSNNFGGNKDKAGEYFKFHSSEAGIIGFCMNLKTYEMNTFQNIDELSGYYVNGNKNKPATLWIDSVLWFYNKIKDNQTAYFGEEPNYSTESYAYIMTNGVMNSKY